jgi:hypothetical protein
LSSRPQLDPYTVYPNPDASPANSSSMASSFTSQPTIVQKLSQISYSCSWAGASPVGTISIEGSNDYSIKPGGAGYIQNPGTWNKLVLSYNGSTITDIPLSGNSGSGMVDIAATGLYAVRLIYTAASGTGNMTVVINAKVA